MKSYGCDIKCQNENKVRSSYGLISINGRKRITPNINLSYVFDTALMGIGRRTKQPGVLREI